MVDARLSQNPRNLAFLACQHCKTASGEGLLGLSGPEVVRTPDQQSAAKREMLKKLLQIGLAGAGIGIGGRSLLGMHNMLNPAEAPDPYAYTSPIPTPFGIPTQRDDEEEKRAADEPGVFGKAINWAAENVMPKELPPVANPLATGTGIPAAVGMAAAGVGGGWWLTDYIMRRRRQAQADDEMAGAEKEYQDAMAEQYRSAMRAKTAGDDLGIDNLFELCHNQETTKTAEVADYNPWKAIGGTEAWEKMKGVFGLAALVAGGTSAYATYDWTKHRSRKAMLDKAVRARARMRQSGTPVPMMAMPTPVEV